MYVDAHTHLNDPKLFFDYPKYLAEFQDIWWQALINIWVNDERNNKAIQIAKNAPADLRVKVTIWYHPYDAGFEEIPDDMETLRQTYLQNKEYVVWIWEWGIDIHHPQLKEKLSMQKQIFAMQADIAQEFNLPLVVHSRDDFQTTIDILNNYKNLKIYFHCRGYWPDEIQKVLAMFPNVRVGFAGNLTYPKAQVLRESLLALPMQQILLETDAPYLSPQIKRWQTNTPANVAHIYDFVANLLNIDLIKLQNQIKQNFDFLYK